MGESAEEPTGRSGARRDEFSCAAAELLVDRGLGDMSLRAIAAELGTSHRMLLYYFDSREALVAQALDQVRQDYQAELDSALAAEATSIVALAERLWAFLLEADSQRYVRLQLQAWSRSLTDASTYAPFLMATHDLRPRLELAMKSDGVDAQAATRWATLIQASLYGLMLDVHSGADRESVDASFEMLVSMLRSSLQLGGSPKQTD